MADATPSTGRRRYSEIREDLNDPVVGGGILILILSLVCLACAIIHPPPDRTGVRRLPRPEPATLHEVHAYTKGLTCVMPLSEEGTRPRARHTEYPDQVPCAGLHDVPTRGQVYDNGNGLPARETEVVPRTACSQLRETRRAAHRPSTALHREPDETRPTIQTARCRGNNQHGRLTAPRLNGNATQLPDVLTLQTTQLGSQAKPPSLPRVIDIARSPSEKLPSAPFGVPKRGQACSHLPQRHVTNINDVRSTLVRSTEGRQDGHLNDKRPSTGGVNVYRSIAFAMLIVERGQTPRVLLQNTNAINVILMIKSAMAGGILDLSGFDHHPTRESEALQNTGILASPFMSRDWSLPLYLMCWGYHDTEQPGLICLLAIRAEASAEATLLDADYKERAGAFTTDHGLLEVVLGLHDRYTKRVPTDQAAISSNNERRLYLPPGEEQRRHTFTGADSLTYDFGNSGGRRNLAHPKARECCKHVLFFFRNAVPSDGLLTGVIDPSTQNSGPESERRSPTYGNGPYVPGHGRGPLLSVTASTSTKLQQCQRLHNVHDLYVARRSYKACGAVFHISHSRPSTTFHTAFGRQSWYTARCIISDSVRYSTSSVLMHKVLTMPMAVSADMCVVPDHAKVKLHCCFWHAMRSFGAWAENHDDQRSVDPRCSSTTSNTLQVRLNLLPLFLYALTHHSDDLRGAATCARFFGSLRDVGANTQLLWRPTLLTCIVGDQQETEIKPYLPRGAWSDTLHYPSYHDLGRAALSPLMPFTNRSMLRAGLNLLSIYTLVRHSDDFRDTATCARYFGAPKDKDMDTDTDHSLGQTVHTSLVVNQQGTEIKPYLPRGAWGGMLLCAQFQHSGEDFAVISQVNVVCPRIWKGSAIIAQKKPRISSGSRAQPSILLLLQSREGTGIAEMYWDDGEFMWLHDVEDYSLIELAALKNALAGHGVHRRHDSIMVIETVVVCGIIEEPAEVRINDHRVKFAYSPDGQFVKVTRLHLVLAKPFVVVWRC